MLKTIFIFLLAGICEIGGGYLIWQWLKNDKSIYYGGLGGLLLVLYGAIATFQTASFAKVYATYGGVFVVLSLVWVYKMENYVPDKFDVIGSIIVLIGVGIIYFGKNG